ncbi:DNA-binding response regulator [Lachnospiraceae bacterium]|nr:DNA-binding response regulator [Lachnospiraceae bacterium]
MVNTTTKEAKIVLVDDETDILDLLEKSLNIEGFYNILRAENGLSAVNICRENRPSMIILDVMLPDIDGYEVCSQIREFSHCPILFLSSKSEDVDKILGLAVGGDDYVTKPFSPKEVVYRVKASLRREQYKHTPQHGFSIHIGELLIDTNGCRVMKNGKQIELTAREFEILQYLAENAGWVVSRERLYEIIWGEDSFGCDNTIMVHVRHLREKIEENPSAPQYIITVKGLGYKLVNPYEK